MPVKNLQSIHSKLLSPSEPGKGVQDSRRGSSVNGNLRTNDANGKRRPSGNGHISRSSSRRNFGFLRYLIHHIFHVNVPILPKMDQCHIFCQ